MATDSWWDAGHYSRIRCLQAVMKAYPAGTAHLNLLPLAPREPGERDILLNAIVAQNHGCSHYLVRGSAAGSLVVSADGGPERDLPRRLEDLHNEVALLVLPERRRQRSYPRAVEVKMSNYALNRRKRRG